MRRADSSASRCGPSFSSGIPVTSAPCRRKRRMLRSYVGDSAKTVSPGFSKLRHKNSTSSSEPLPVSTWFGWTPCHPAIHSRMGANPAAGPYCSTAGPWSRRTATAASRNSSRGNDSGAGIPRVKLIDSSVDIRTPNRDLMGPQAQQGRQRNHGCGAVSSLARKRGSGRVWPRLPREGRCRRCCFPCCRLRGCRPAPRSASDR